MKSIVLKIAAGLILTFGTAFSNAQAQTRNFSRSENTLINFQLSSVVSGAHVIIRNSSGQIIRIKSFFTNYCNIESIILNAGVYSYTIINGKQVAAGNFSVK